MKTSAFMIIACCVVSAVGCSSSPKTASSEHGAKQTLNVRGDCDFASCGVPPSNLESAPVLSCDSGSSQSCDWATPSDSSSVSYRVCAVSECPPKPEVDCPAETVRSSQQCGSENDGPCLWTTTCAPPRNTTPCPDSHGCDNLPVLDIGIICSDGSNGGFVCVTDGQHCKYERNCD